MYLDRRIVSFTSRAKIASLVPALFLAVTFLVAPVVAQSSAQTDLRVELSLMVDRIMTTKDAPQVDEAAREALEEVRSRLDKISGDELAELEVLAPQVAKANKAFELLHLVANMRTRRAADKSRWAAEANVSLAGKSASLPGAAYPNLIGDIEQSANVIGSAFTNPLDDCCLLKLLVDELSDLIDVDIEAAIEAFTLGGIDICNDSCDQAPTVGATDSVSSFGQCDQIDRSTTLEAYTLRTAFIVVEAARDVASRICAQSLGLVVAGGNAELLCIPMDIVYIVAKSLHDNVAMCDDFIDEAEIDGSYERAGHLHGDLATAQASVNDLDADLVAHGQALSAHDARIDQKIADNEAAMTGAIGDSETAILDAIETHDTDVKTLLADQRAFFTQLEVEEALLNQESEAVYYLPSAQGGNLETARGVVAETIAGVTSSGEDVHRAAGLLADADGLIAAGHYKKAFDTLGAAYFDAIKRQGENKPSINSLP